MAGERQPGLLATVRAVLWSFLGIRARKGYQHDTSQLKPHHVIITGLVLAIIFVVTLVTVAQYIVSR